MFTRLWSGTSLFYLFTLIKFYFIDYITGSIILNYYNNVFLKFKILRLVAPRNSAIGATQLKNVALPDRFAT